jgi:predicted nucleic acid-binding protein
VTLAEKKVYWDTCTWLTFINGEPGADDCQYVIECARRGEVKIWTSSLALAESYKVKCNDEHRALAEARDREFEDYIEQGFVVEVQCDHPIAVLSRKLCRAHARLKKPTDGIHLASAVLWNADELHTFDNENLLALDGHVRREDGKLLKICKPPPRPPLSKGTESLFKPSPTPAA